MRPGRVGWRRGDIFAGYGKNDVVAVYDPVCLRFYLLGRDPDVAEAVVSSLSSPPHAWLSVAGCLSKEAAADGGEPGADGGPASVFLRGHRENGCRSGKCKANFAAGRTTYRSLSPEQAKGGDADDLDVHRGEDHRAAEGHIPGRAGGIVPGGDAELCIAAAGGSRSRADRGGEDRRYSE